MDFNLTVEQQQIREEIKKVCKEFPDAYWREIDGKKAYPDAFVRKLSDLGWLAALIPEESAAPASASPKRALSSKRSITRAESPRRATRTPSLDTNPK